MIRIALKGEKYQNLGMIPYQAIFRNAQQFAQNTTTFRLYMTNQFTTF